MYLEVCGESTKLLEFHKQILEDDENNDAILKRQVDFSAAVYVHSKISLSLIILNPAESWRLILWSREHTVYSMYN